MNYRRELFYCVLDELIEQFTTRLLGQMGNITTAFGIFSKKALDDPSSSTIKNHVSTLVEFYHDGDSPDVED